MPIRQTIGGSRLKGGRKNQRSTGQGRGSRLKGTNQRSASDDSGEQASPYPNSMPWERGRSLDQLIVTVWRRM